MNEANWLAEPFDKSRAHLRKVAYRILGSTTEAEDAVQETWMRVSRSDAGEIGNLGGWLTTALAHVCLDMLRSRRSRQLGQEGLTQRAPAAEPAPSADPETELSLADSLGPALLVVLETLAPAERVAFVLHDMFDVSFDEIASIVGRSPEAARQLASRARRRVKGGTAAADADVVRQREVVTAFLTASRTGDLDALLAVLSPEVVVRADALAVRTATATGWGGPNGLMPEIRGAREVAEAFKGRARGATPALIDGAPGAIWAQSGQTRSVFVFTVENGQVVAIDLVMDPSQIGLMRIVTEVA